MFDFLRKNNKELDEIIKKIQMNLSNNYKDEAQAHLKKLEAMYSDLVSQGKLSEKQQTYYKEILNGFLAQMKNFTHKDQKPNW